MNKFSLKSASSTLIVVFGATLSLSTAQATTQDGMSGEVWSNSPQSEASPTVYYDDIRIAAKGPQGPLRTDVIDETVNSRSEPAEPARTWPENFDN